MSFSRSHLLQEAGMGHFASQADALPIILAGHPLLEAPPVAAVTQTRVGAKGKKEEKNVTYI